MLHPGVDSLLGSCWAAVSAVGPTWTQHWDNVSCLLDTPVKNTQSEQPEISADLKSQNAVAAHFKSRQLPLVDFVGQSGSVQSTVNCPHGDAWGYECGRLITDTLCCQTQGVDQWTPQRRLGAGSASAPSRRSDNVCDGIVIRTDPDTSWEMTARQTDVSSLSTAGAATYYLYTPPPISWPQICYLSHLINWILWNETAHFCWSRYHNEYFSIYLLSCVKTILALPTEKLGCHEIQTSISSACES